MPRGNPKPTPRAIKPHKVKSIKLSDRLCPIAENSLKGQTQTIEFGLTMIDYLAAKAAQGDDQAIALLSRFGVEAKLTEKAPIVVWKPNGSEACWIV
jgi:hypothetical protein